MADYPGLPHTRFSSGNIAQTLTSSSQSRTTPRNAVFVAKIATYLCLCDTNSPQNSTMNLLVSDHKTVKILSSSRQGTSSHHQKSYLDLRFWYSIFVNSNNISTHIETASCLKQPQAFANLDLSGVRACSTPPQRRHDHDPKRPQEWQPFQIFDIIRIERVKN